MTSVASTVFTTRLFRNAFVYASTGVVRNAIPFLLLPILTRSLTPAELGVVATFEAVLAIALVCISLNMHGAIAVNFFTLKRDELKAYVGNVLLVSGVSCAMTYAATHFALRYFGGAEVQQLIDWAPSMALAALSQAVCSVTLTLWQVEQKPLSYGLFQIAQTILNVALSLCFVVVFGWGWGGRLLGIILSSIAFGTLSLAVLYRRGFLTLTMNRPHIRDALSFGLPLMPHSLSVWILAGVDRLFITSMLSVAATGIYSVGYQVGMIVGLLATSFNQAWSPFLFERLRDGDHQTKVRLVQFTYLYNVVIVGIAVALSLIAPWFLEVFVGDAFRDSQKYVFWVSLGYAANGMYFMVANYIFYAKKTHLLAWVTVTAASLNVVLNYSLIPAYGALGAAQATTASFAASFILTWILSAHVYDMPWRLWRRPGYQGVDVVKSAT